MNLLKCGIFAEAHCPSKTTAFLKNSFLLYVFTKLILTLNI